jgi:L-lactate dehydrogenase complex protein LldE
MRVALFVTCVNDAVFPSTGVATVRLLERLGVTVDFPAAQSCCGQPQFNTGYRAETAPLVRRTVRAFEGYDHVVTPSGSCAAMVRHHYPSFGTDAGALAPRVYELTEFLVDRLGVIDVGASFPHRVTYHSTCHSLRVTRVGDAPVRLLRKVDGLDLVELPRADECCGFGGTFSIKNAETSSAMLDDKLDCVEGTGAGFCTALDASCLLQIGGGLSRRRSHVQPLHIAEILAST